MKTYRPAAVAALALTLGACASTPPPLSPVPGLDGQGREPANSPTVLDMLHRERIAAASDDSREARDRLTRARYIDELKEGDRQWSRSVEPATLVHLPGEQEPVSKTVTVPFAFASTRFAPDIETMFALRRLLASAERVEVRGRTDGLGDPSEDEKTARVRAEAARMWLVERGMPSDAVSVSYLPGGDFVAVNDTFRGREQNRRVELEFFFDEPFVAVK